MLLYIEYLMTIDNQFKYRSSALIRMINKLYSIITNAYREGAGINYMVHDD